MSAGAIGSNGKGREVRERQPNVKFDPVQYLPMANFSLFYGLRSIFRFICELAEETSSLQDLRL